MFDSLPSEIYCSSYSRRQKSLSKNLPQQKLKQTDIITHYMSSGWVVNIMRKSYETQLIFFFSRGLAAKKAEMCRRRLFFVRKVINLLFPKRMFEEFLTQIYLFEESLEGQTLFLWMFAGSKPEENLVVFLLPWPCKGIFKAYWKYLMYEKHKRINHFMYHLFWYSKAFVMEFKRHRREYFLPFTSLTLMGSKRKTIFHARQRKRKEMFDVCQILFILFTFIKFYESNFCCEEFGWRLKKKSK